MNNQNKIGYESPLILVCQLEAESVICASTGIDDLKVKDTHDWGWEE